jgi:hypothetical protein
MLGCRIDRPTPLLACEKKPPKGGSIPRKKSALPLRLAQHDGSGEFRFHYLSFIGRHALEFPLPGAICLAYVPAILRGPGKPLLQFDFPLVKPDDQAFASSLTRFK